MRLIDADRLRHDLIALLDEPWPEVAEVAIRRCMSIVDRQDTVTDCNQQGYATMTNREWLHSLSIDELADFVCHGRAPMCKHLHDPEGCADNPVGCEKCCNEWLERERSDDTAPTAGR